MKNANLRRAGLALVLPLAALATPAMAQESAVAAGSNVVAAPTHAPITAAEVEAAQRAWGYALVAIATEYDTKGHAAAKQLAENVIDSAYGYGLGPVLFKPTLAAAPTTFRTDRDGAISYFVGGNPAYPGDSGFALKGWRSYEIENAGILTNGNSATSMGNVTVIDASGNRTTVDKTWGYVRGADGKLRIVLHHSSLPYQTN
ncbi:phosphoribosyl-AMP cyclohydrolase [Sphingopyxis bauzanensis]|uniref:Phosphoribosyl-AMP cyclohydrolase n=1 Tax=Sphingopyxis bauzanensis TaxID=651663 RepID=A0A246K0G6_9SPHN|nr:phosphoribosyl-AMP cyclohydrolase [Sphingopyxis bauzanensis]OWQ98980.1 phosphoribosyl-AMP cyclohydrolase [Sphingopyxis bauzanensis]GGJ64931.1 hypothetical protein GCM10011393_39060 [Sphingopyxis bauzanensis]